MNNNYKNYPKIIPQISIFLTPYNSTNRIVDSSIFIKSNLHSVFYTIYKENEYLKYFIRYSCDLFYGINKINNTVNDICRLLSNEILILTLLDIEAKQTTLSVLNIIKIQLESDSISNKNDLYSILINNNNYNWLIVINILKKVIQHGYDDISLPILQSVLEILLFIIKNYPNEFCTTLLSFDLVEILYNIVYKKCNIKPTYNQITSAIDSLTLIFNMENINWISILKYNNKKIQTLIKPISLQQPMLFVYPVINILLKISKDNKYNILLGKCGIIDMLLLFFNYNSNNKIKIEDSLLKIICELLQVIFTVPQNTSILSYSDPELIKPLIRLLDSNNNNLIYNILLCFIEITKDSYGFHFLSQFSTFIYSIVEISQSEDEKIKELSDQMIKNWIGKNNNNNCLLNELNTESLFYLLQCDNQSLIVRILRVLYERLYHISLPLSERILCPIKSGWIYINNEFEKEDNDQLKWTKRWCILNDYNLYIYEYITNNIIGPYLKIINCYNLVDLCIIRIRDNKSNYILLSNKNIVNSNNKKLINICLQGKDGRATKRWYSTFRSISIYLYLFILI